MHCTEEANGQGVQREVIVAHLALIVKMLVPQERELAGR